MKKAIFLRGAPGSGKSTLIKNLDLDLFLMSRDKIRTMNFSPILNSHGEFTINNENEDFISKEFEKILLQKIERGEFIIIEGVYNLLSEIKPVLQKLFDNDYQILFIDLFGIDVQKTIAQNNSRNKFLRVNDKVIKKFYEEALTLKDKFFVNEINKFCKNLILFSDLDNINEYNLKINQIKSFYQEAPVITNLDNYEKIIHIGDIQGCFNVLNLALNSINKNYFYIFVGDYLDRGPQNSEVLNYLIEISKNNDNLIFIRGNHEIHLEKYLQNNPKIPKEFLDFTLPDLKKNCNFDEIKRFTKNFKDFFIYEFNKQKVFVNHPGFGKMPNFNDFTLIPKIQFAKGVGYYSDNVDKEFTESELLKSLPERTIQIHGHRNNSKIDSDQYPYSFNLEFGIERDGFLRIAQLSLDENSKNVWTFNSFENNFCRKYRERIKNKFTELLEVPWLTAPPEIYFTSQEMIELRTHSGVRERVSVKFPHISSFNFTKSVFFDKTWDELTTKTRGLFINNQTNEIIARSYDKFFHIDEKEETKLENLQNINYPIKFYKKENGFLGLLGYDSQTDSLFFSSKSAPESEFTQYFINIFHQKVNTKTLHDLKIYLKNQEACMVFEVIDPKNDPHIIKYTKPDIILLDIFARSKNIKKLDYKNLQKIGELFNLKVKSYCFSIPDFNKLKGIMNVTSDLNFNFKKEPIEGFVCESNNFCFKIKTGYYNFYKSLRVTKDVLFKILSNKNLNDKQKFIQIENLKNRYKSNSSQNNSEQNYSLACLFVSFMIDKFNISKEYFEKNIIDIREDFLLYCATNNQMLSNQSPNLAPDESINLNKQIR